MLCRRGPMTQATGSCGTTFLFLLHVPLRRYLLGRGSSHACVSKGCKKHASTWALSYNLSHWKKEDLTSLLQCAHFMSPLLSVEKRYLMSTTLPSLSFSIFTSWPLCKLCMLTRLRFCMQSEECLGTTNTQSTSFCIICSWLGRASGSCVSNSNRLSIFFPTRILCSFPRYLSVFKTW